MLLNPAVALLMGNPFAGSANTLGAPNKPMPATSKVAIAMIRISFSSDEFHFRRRPDDNDPTPAVVPTGRS
jgi:hypothetical protein